MLAGPNLHLTYCTNIHPGETWLEVFKTLKEYILPIKENLAPDKEFGIGLRLSDVAANELLEANQLEVFINWLQENRLYVFTMNGFPFGKFHHNKVKDDVHKPDWVTLERFNYTLNLVNILTHLLPDHGEGGISTSPLSYKPWFKNEKEDLELVFNQATKNLLVLVEKLISIKKETGKLIHIDIEPEPDGLLENSGEVISYFKDRLVPAGIKYLKKVLDYNPQQAESAIKEHIQICYDVCHFAVGYEKAFEVFEKFKKEGIKIGKIQISAALKANIPKDEAERNMLYEKFLPFVESTYLHQVVARNENDGLTQYPDLPQALENLNKPNIEEWRIHFHVPIFMSKYSQLESTQIDIEEVLHQNQKNPVTHHLEVETYTWEVLPTEDRLDLTHSIIRELTWVNMLLEGKKPFQVWVKGKDSQSRFLF
ncbi:MAG: metabolite traffic protein EboE [Bacteroidota bacterium]|nr:metabolite traffic protein EboE [Bacteroidota bacterium]